MWQILSQVPKIAMQNAAEETIYIGGWSVQERLSIASVLMDL
jgi:isocitrate lyase